ncbi:MAG: hypothetical protein P8Q14_06230 [Vicingaceae bacterium]|nr:hypothetical protein [Vicingaceae bacterium]
MKTYLSILFLFLTLGLSAQQGIDDVDYKYDKEFLESLVQEKIDSFRESRNLPIFTKDGILDLAAEDQTFYILRAGRVEHKQPSAKKDSPFKRVLYYNGMHGKVGENCYKLIVDTYTKLPGETKKTKLKSYDNVAKAIALYWMNSKDGQVILSNDKYVNYGISIMLEEEEEKKTIVATHVVGSQPFVLPVGAKPMRDDYGIKPYDKTKCAEIDKKYSYLPHLMSDNIFFKNGEIYFYYHDLALLKTILKESNDGIALDIIDRSQFNCGEGNKVYPSKVHKGVLLEPISKSQLFGKNELKKGNELEVSLGPIPEYIDTNNVEFNILILKDNCLCQTIIYNSLGGDNLKSLDLNFMLDTLSVSSRADSVMNQLAFTVPFELNKAEYNSADLKPFLDSLSLNRFSLKRINVTAYSSLDGNIKANEIIQKKRANSILKVIKQYKLQDVETNIITKENYEGFYESIKGSPYEEELTALSKDELRAFINSDKLTYDLEPYLASQRKAEITLVVEKVFMDESLFGVLPEWFNKALAEKDYGKAKVYQSVMLKNIENGNIGSGKILDIKIPHSKETVSFINNQIALRWYLSETNNKDSLNRYLLRELETQLVVDPANEFLRYNKTVLRLLIFSNNYTSEADPKVLLREIRALANTSIEKWMINRLELNYNIISADYYYDNKKFREREKALKSVKSALFSSKLDRDQSLRIANYFMFQLRIDWAIDLMKPFAMKENIDEEFLYTFLTVAIYNKEKVTDKELVGFMDKAKELNKERFCNLFGAPNMSFQNLKNVEVKKLYCETCN